MSREWAENEQRITENEERMSRELKNKCCMVSIKNER